LVGFRCFQQVVYVLGEHHADGVDRIMPIETFVHEALRGATHRRFISECDLGLDNRVKRGVCLFIRQANAGAAVIVPHALRWLSFGVPDCVGTP
jgi:hypothetical protein